ncbi:TonB-dependent receptor [Hirschia litorea]|uniref:TonB-dependent receptor n=1 Tax=Hirschia litorea TaxID=1199156 RepID=A0ABW2IJ09_9PROT
MSNRLKNTLMCTSLITVAMGLVAPTAMAAIVEGKVTTGGAPVEGAIVSIDKGQTTSTRADGSYRFANLAEGEHTLSVSYVGAERKTATISATDATPTAYNFVLGGDDERTMDTILITGQRGSLFAGINQQRAADNLVAVLSADALGQFPDQNVAESARRVAGISVANDQGEGRYVIIRGLDSSLNSTSVNGVRMASPEADTRSVALDVVDADILDSITITKSLTPDLDGDGIGGSIDIKTLSAFDKDGLFFKAKVDGIYSESSDKVTPKVGITVANTFLNDMVGVAGSLSFNRRDFTTTNKEADWAYDFDDAEFELEELEMRKYEVVRERLSGALNFDFRPTANTDLYLRTLYNSFNDNEIRTRTTYREKLDRDIKIREETQDLWSVQIGGETRIDAITIDYQAAYSHAEEEEPDRIDGAFRLAKDNRTSVDFDLSDPSLPTLADTNADFFNAALFEFDELEYLNGLTEEDEFAAKIDIKRDGNVFGTSGFVKGGLKLRLREKSNDVASIIYDGHENDLILSNFLSGVEYSLDNIGPTVDYGALSSFYFGNTSDFEVNSVDSAIASFASDYKATENIYAGYLMSQMDFGTALVTYGARVEATDYTGKGYITTAYATEDLANAADGAPNGVIVASDVDVDDNEGTFAYADYQTARHSYVDFLPSLNAKFDINENLVARGAYYASIARPSLKHASPSSEVELDGGDYEGTIGNPDLDRQQAHNFDVGIEFYPSNSGVLSLGFFMKDIEKPIAEITYSDYAALGVVFKEASQFVNLEDANVTGLEFNYQQSFDGILPGVWGGLIVGANYTLLNSQTTYTNEDGTTRSIPLPKTSDNIGNVMFGFDKYGLDLRAALTYRSEYLDEIGSNGRDRYFKDRYQVDLTAKYALTDSLQMVGEISNVTDESEHAVFKTQLGTGLSQYDEYGYTAKFGVRYTY